MFSIVIPLFNEEDNIEPLIKETYLYLKKYNNFEIILVNDASTDKTLEIIKKVNNDNISIINNDKNKGQSFSIHKGISKSSNETIITIDGDGQNDPKDIPKLLEIYLSQSEIKLVGGIRKKRKDSLVKITSSKIANFIRSKILKDNCIDTGCSLKVFNKNIFLNFPYFDGMHRFLPALFTGYGYKTEFISVNHRKRKYGNSNYGTANRLFRGIRDMVKVKRLLKDKSIR